MTWREWNRLDRQLSELIADQKTKREHPEEWLAQVKVLREKLEEKIDESRFER